MTDSSVAVREVGDCAEVRVVGRATATFGPALREFLLGARGRGVRRFVFDLAQCEYMDSTFIGVLAMAATEAREAAGEVCIANAGPAPRRLLTGLGVHTLFTYADTPLADGPWEPLGANPHDTASIRLQALGRTALEAHEALGAANPDNVPRFRDVVEALRREAQEGRP